MFPPHVPAPAKSIALNQAWMRIKLLFVSTLLGFVAGVTGATIVVAWFVPYYSHISSPLILPFIPSRSAPASAIDQTYSDRVESRLASVFEVAAEDSGLSVASAHTKIGEAVSVSSDGWFAMPLSKKPDTTRMWRIIFSSGAVESVSRVVYDPVYGVAFVKIEKMPGDSTVQAPVFGSMPEVGGEVFATAHNRIVKTTLVRRAVDAPVELLSAPLPQLAIDHSLGAHFLFDESGSLIALVGVGGIVVPVEYIQPQLRDIFTKSQVRYASVGVQGWYASNVPIIKNDRLLTTGFMVTSVGVKNLPIKKGDVIEKIDDRVVSADAAWYTSQSAVTISLMRAEKRIELQVPLHSLVN